MSSCITLRAQIVTRTETRTWAICPGSIRRPCRGFITDAATKRRIRNYVELAHQGEPGMNIIIQQATNINRIIAEVREAAGVPLP